jgi:hypothetical protein
MSERPTYTESELVDLVRSIDVRAPRELHERIEAMVAERGTTQARRPILARWRLVAVPALGVLALALALAAVLSGGGGGQPLTLDRTVALTLRPATMAAPAEDPRNDSQLMVSVDGVSFPYWEESFGFRTTGERSDRVDGRRVTTVFYADGHNNWIGYAIVAGAAPHVAGGAVTRLEGVSYRILHDRSAEVVTWVRDGHLCVVAGHGVSRATLLSLASWRGPNGSLAS